MTQKPMVGQHTRIYQHTIDTSCDTGERKYERIAGHGIDETGHLGIIWHLVEIPIIVQSIQVWFFALTDEGNRSGKFHYGYDIYVNVVRRDSKLIYTGSYKKLGKRVEFTRSDNKKRVGELSDSDKYLWFETPGVYERDFHKVDPSRPLAVRYVLK